MISYDILRVGISQRIYDVNGTMVTSDCLQIDSQLQKSEETILSPRLQGTRRAGPVAPMDAGSGTILTGEVKSGGEDLL